MIITIHVDTTGLEAGQHYDGYIHLTSNGGNEDVHIELDTNAGDNLLLNYNFEDGLTHWYSTHDTANYTLETNGVSGSYCVKGTELNKGNLGRLYQDVTGRVKVGEEYKIAGWIKTEDVEGSIVIGLDYVLPSGWTPGDGFIKEIGHLCQKDAVLSGFYLILMQGMEQLGGMM